MRVLVCSCVHLCCVFVEDDGLCEGFLCSIVFEFTCIWRHLHTFKCLSFVLLIFPGTGAMGFLCTSLGIASTAWWNNLYSCLICVQLQRVILTPVSALHHTEHVYCLYKHQFLFDLILLDCFWISHVVWACEAMWKYIFMPFCPHLHILRWVAWEKSKVNLTQQSKNYSTKCYSPNSISVIINVNTSFICWLRHSQPFKFKYQPIMSFRSGWTHHKCMHEGIIPIHENMQL